MAEFRTHIGEIVTGERLQAALNVVADFYVENAKGIRKEDLYASHVTDDQKEDYLRKGLLYAEEIRLGKVTNFTIWQRVNTELTGECIALLP